mmetsp:Transcript_118074/g.329136  ORF Transcript_118074/g.329136 Transcript_118074/m.329136 type:complete len:204 (+) Transcript_118074:338-949(+)
MLCGSKRFFTNSLRPPRRLASSSSASSHGALASSSTGCVGASAAAASRRSTASALNMGISLSTGTAAFSSGALSWAVKLDCITKAACSCSAMASDCASLRMYSSLVMPRFNNCMGSGSAGPLRKGLYKCIFLGCLATNASFPSLTSASRVDAAGSVGMLREKPGKIGLLTSAPGRAFCRCSGGGSQAILCLAASRIAQWWIRG